MIKNYSLTFLVFLCFVFAGFGQISEGFENGLPTAYTTGNYNLSSGIWNGANIIRGTIRNSGSYSCQMRSSPVGQITSPTIISGGLGNVEFYARGSTSSGSVEVNYSLDGGSSWSAATGSPFNLSTTFTQYTAIINDASPNIIFQFKRAGATVYVDDVSTTTFGSLETPDFVNLQFPEVGDIALGGVFDVYGQVYEAGVTPGAGQGAGIVAEVGYSTINNNPNLWTNWIATTPNSGCTDTCNFSQNDEYLADLGAAITVPGTYYYATRFQLNGGPWVYGGILADGSAGNFWDGGPYISGVLTVRAPEIEIQGNGNEIVSGDVTPSLTDHTDFGSVNVTSGFVNRVFTIRNTGNGVLNLTGASPYVTITGANASDFTVIPTFPNNTINGSSSTTFTIQFDPTALGARNATVTVANNDSNESSYTFAITGNGTNSSTSDIIADAGFTYTQNHDYLLYQSATVNTTASSVGVFKFSIRDGGASSPDADFNTTALNSITFNVTNIANLRSAGLFGGASQTTFIPATMNINTGAGTITFTGINNANATALDNGVADVTLRVSYLTTVTDNQQLQYTVASATANASGSVFGTANAGGATSLITADRNRIEVTADRLQFTTQPMSTSVNTNLNTFRISAVDINSNVDLDRSLSINLTTSGVGMTSTSPYALTNGELAISNVQFNATQTNINLTGTTTGLAFSNTATSTNFDILDVSLGTYRTTSNGTWPTGTATWERLTGTGWNPATPSSNTTDLLIIRHVITSRASFAAPSPYTSMIVENGGSFDDGHNSTFGNLTIKNGGTFIASDPGVDIRPTGTLTVQNGGLFVINSSTLNHADGLFDGIENFEPNSTVEVRQFDNDSGTGEDDLIDSDSAISTNSEGFYFGNLFINFTHSLPANAKALTLVGLTGTHKLCSGDLIIANQTLTEHIQLANRTTNVEIGGNVIVTKNRFVFGAVSSSNIVHTVKGDVIVNGAGAVIDLNATNSSVASVLVNIEGDLIGTQGALRSTDAGCGFAFTGNILQNIDVADAVPYDGINTYVKNNAEVQLLNNNLKLNNSSTFTVENGGTLNFNWAADGITPLLITNGGNGVNTFNSNQGSTLKITSPNGITSIANLGNVQTSPSNRTFNQTASFYYIGKQNQVTGNALTNGSTDKNVFVNLDTNLLELRLSNETGIGIGGKLEIQRGIVIGEEAGATDRDFYGPNGRLVMTGGEYRISTLTTDPLADYLPQLRNYSNYALSGGAIHLNGNDEYQILLVFQLITI